MKKFLILNGYGKGAAAAISRSTAFFAHVWPEEEPALCTLFGPDEDTVSKLAENIPWSRIRTVIKKTYCCETFIAMLAQEAAADGVYFFCEDLGAAGLAARLSVRCGGSACIGACAAEQRGDKLYLKKRVYSHHMEARFLVKKFPCFVTLSQGLPINTETTKYHPILETQFLEDNETDKDICFLEDRGENSLAEAKLLVAGGNGTGGSEGLACLRELSECMGAEFGVSKPAAMGGWAPLDSLIGISGTMTAPELCIVAGVSGAAAFFAGIEKSGTILAVNTDPEAPIMGQADATVQEDYRKIIPELIRLIRQDTTLNLQREPGNTK